MTSPVVGSKTLPNTGTRSSILLCGAEKRESTILRESLPLSLITPRPLFPSGVEIAAIVSSISVGILLRMNHYLTVLSVALAFRADQIIVGNGEMNNSPLFWGHRIQLEGLAQTFNILRRGDCHQPQFFRAAFPVTVTVERHALTLFLQYSIAQILQSIEGLCISCEENRRIVAHEDYAVTLCLCGHFEPQLEGSRFYECRQ